MIRFFYSLTISRKRSNTNKLYKLINQLIYAEYLLVGKICGTCVRYFYKKCQKELNSLDRTRKVIVSFTTIPSRIETLPIMLKSIFNQTVMPDKIILWITDEIKNSGKVENILQEEIRNGLEVRYIKDVRVHTKYFYAMKEFPNDIVITIDDDILYSEDLIQKLLLAHENNPTMVIAARAHEITVFGEKVNEYKKWRMLAPGVENYQKDLLATGVGGVLYPPNSLYSDWLNVQLFLDLCPTADDIWLKIMEIKKGTKVYKLEKFTKEAFIIGNTQEIALSKSNVNEGRNDRLLQKCIDYYRLNASDFV